MELTKLNIEMKVGGITARPLSSTAQKALRDQASQVASVVLGSGQSLAPIRSALYCTEVMSKPTEREEVSPQALDILEIKARNSGDFSVVIDAIKGLIDFVHLKIDDTDFSIGYDEEERFHADLKEMSALFRTFQTAREVYDEKVGKSSEFKTWFEAEMGNLVVHLLKEVADNNQVARRGQLSTLSADTPVYDYVAECIGNLDDDTNPQGWKRAALCELEKFLAIDCRTISSQEERLLVNNLNSGLTLVRCYF